MPYFFHWALSAPPSLFFANPPPSKSTETYLVFSKKTVPLGTTWYHFKSAKWYSCYNVFTLRFVLTVPGTTKNEN